MGIPEAALKRYDELLVGFTHDQAAVRVKSEFGLDQEPNTVRRRYFAWRHESGPLPECGPPIPKKLIVPFAGKLIALADCHLPYFHNDVLEDALARAETEKFKTLVLVGDTIDNDWCSQFMNVSAPGDRSQVSEHIQIVYRVLKALTDTFETIYVIKGNHDDRPLKAVARLLDMDHTWRIFTTTSEGTIYPRFTITDRFWMVMKDSPQGDYRFTHQKNYSTIRGRVAQRLAEKYRCNIISSHCHDQVKSRVDDCWAVAPGCIADPEKVEYIQMRDTLNPSWAVGYATLDDTGVPHLHG